ncbi:hypothetical protein GEV33_015007 [Tenebrio molitor]|uniref:Potassium channel domain-containing protein n=2 Tax=Tenebrio molitor TaxID=7067 RepID=A0A8J6H425_TENMO|nr:hypothetical protein GEV33_015007 [Tenebrio molitor]
MQNRDNVGNRFFFLGGYGSIAPRTTLGKAVTMGYAMLGIPLTLLYLSSIGSILSRVARGVFSRALCCCLCSNCGYCCYDEKRMAEKERRMKKKRQQLEMQQQMALQEPFYVRSNSIHNSLHSPLRDGPIKEMDSLSCTDNESKSSMHGLSILAPILLCLAMMFIYICLGTFALYKLENWSLLDGFYFCFMSLTTIGFGNMVPGTDPFRNHDSNTTIWFCSIYIMSGMALTAMCFNVVHDEIVHRLKHQEKAMPKLNSASFTDDLNSADPNLTEETLLSTGTPTLELGSGHDLTPAKIPEVLEGPVITGVYTVPELPENDDNSEDNTEM